MAGEQLEMFDPNDATNTAEDEYSLNVELSFQRVDGQKVTASIVQIGEDADQLVHVLDAMTTFLKNLGFTYVEGLVAVDAEGDDI
ncbi:hypothetical protein [Bradyrhizobium sp. SZCCHNRI2049]|uniref:hypothetical protein n=1 Tax=Bradyrhizobium sp. SZCCHNRI2049 TaxID=3057287 RepID=UPI0029163D6C|nr:hypothetical protein [Bradyrhizobium sp. SZCCHNRI2049]